MSRRTSLRFPIFAKILLACICLSLALLGGSFGYARYQLLKQGRGQYLRKHFNRYAAYQAAVGRSLATVAETLARDGRLRDALAAEQDPGAMGPPETASVAGDLFSVLRARLAGLLQNKDPEDPTADRPPPLPDDGSRDSFRHALLVWATHRWGPAPPHSIAGARDTLLGHDEDVDRASEMAESMRREADAAVAELIERQRRLEEAREEIATALARHRAQAAARTRALMAVAAALERWPADGVPNNPAAWLTTTARRKALDRLRRRTTRIDKAPALKVLVRSTVSYSTRLVYSVIEGARAAADTFVPLQKNS